MFSRTLAINKLLGLQKRKRIIQGGTWAGKTYGVMAVIIDHCTKLPNEHITVVAETIPAIKRGALKDFMQIMSDTGRFTQTRYNATDRVYKFANGSLIEFNSFDSVGKAQAAGKRTGLFINEAPYIAYEIADALIMRTSGNVWIDFNPTHEFWAHTEVLTNDDAEFLLLKYTDNHAIPQTILDELQLKLKKAETSSYWANWCRVYIDGEIGNLQGAVFPNWQQVSEVPKEARFLCYGLDFGFTNDPTACVAIYLLDNAYIIEQVIYQQGLVNRDIATLIKAHGNKGVCVCDSAEPKSIQELKNLGIKAQPCDKGNDSILHGIQLINSIDFSVTENSTDVISELRRYIWEKDKNGNTTNTPIKVFNHAMDAMRYGMSSQLHKKYTGKYVGGWR
jgi:phage terminase large subunit